MLVLMVVLTSSLIWVLVSCVVVFSSVGFEGGITCVWVVVGHPPLQVVMVEVVIYVEVLVSVPEVYVEVAGQIVV